MDSRMVVWRTEEGRADVELDQLKHSVEEETCNSDAFGISETDSATNRESITIFTRQKLARHVGHFAPHRGSMPMATMPTPGAGVDFSIRR